MRIVKWTQPLPHGIQPATIKALSDDIWKNAPKSATSATRDAVAVLDAIARMSKDITRYLYIDRVSKKVQARVLDVVIDYAAWLLEVDASYDVNFNGYDIKTKSHAKGVDIEIYITEECRNVGCGDSARLHHGCNDDCADDCEANHNQAKVPKQWPEFCSDACALEWLYNRAKDIATLDNVEESISKEVEAREAVLVAEVEKQIAESVKIELLEAIDSDDNPVLDVIRVHGKDSRIGADDAARKLESLFRSGVLSM